MPGWNNAACTCARLYHDAESRYSTLVMPHPTALSARSAPSEPRPRHKRRRGNGRGPRQHSRRPRPAQPETERHSLRSQSSSGSIPQQETPPSTETHYSNPSNNRFSPGLDTPTTSTSMMSMPCARPSLPRSRQPQKPFRNPWPTTRWLVLLDEVSTCDSEEHFDLTLLLARGTHPPCTAHL